MLIFKMLLNEQMYAREPAAAPFVSMAEMMNKFQSNTRNTSLARPSSSLAYVSERMELWKYQCRLTSDHFVFAFYIEMLFLISC